MKKCTHLLLSAKKEFLLGAKRGWLTGWDVTVLRDLKIFSFVWPFVRKHPRYHRRFYISQPTSQSVSRPTNKTTKTWLAPCNIYNIVVLKHCFSIYRFIVGWRRKLQKKKRKLNRTETLDKLIKYNNKKGRKDFPISIKRKTVWEKKLFSRNFDVLL